MKKEIISIILAAAMTAGATVSVSAADNADTAGMEVQTSMSASEKTDFINANLSVRLQHLSRLASISSNQALDKLEDEIKTALSDGLTCC